MINTLSITLRLGKGSCGTYDFMTLLLMRKTQASNASLLPLLALSWTVNSNCSSGNVFTTRYCIKSFYFYCINYCINGGLLNTIPISKKSLPLSHYSHQPRMWDLQRQEIVRDLIA